MKCSVRGGLSSTPRVLSATAGAGSVLRGVQEDPGASDVSLAETAAYSARVAATISKTGVMPPSADR